MDDEKMAELCRAAKDRLEDVPELELFDNINIDDVLVAYALATNECGFLIDRRNGTLLRDVHRLIRAMKGLKKQEPKCRLFGILLADDVAGIDAAFLRFCGERNIAILTGEELLPFVRERFMARR